MYHLKVRSTSDPYAIISSTEISTVVTETGSSTSASEYSETGK
jgi:hypothetical protein